VKDATGRLAFFSVSDIAVYFILLKLALAFISLDIICHGSDATLWERQQNSITFRCQESLR
jgi:hypothetical protein